MVTKKSDEAPTPEDLGIIKEEIKAEDNANISTDEPVRRKRGRPKGSSNGTTSAPRKSQSRKDEDVLSFAKQIEGIHVMIAMVTGLPEMVISEAEAVMLSKGLNAVSEEYGLSLDGKTGAAIQLFGAAAIVYGPRAMAIAAKKRKAKEEDITDVNLHETGYPENVASH